MFEINESVHSLIKISRPYDKCHASNVKLSDIVDISYNFNRNKLKYSGGDELMI